MYEGLPKQDPVVAWQPWAGTKLSLTKDYPLSETNQISARLRTQVCVVPATSMRNLSEPWQLEHGVHFFLLSFCVLQADSVPSTPESRLQRDWDTIQPGRVLKSTCRGLLVCGIVV